MYFASRVYPHVYGATFLLHRLPIPMVGLSPCVWGHLRFESCDVQSAGSIPMCMGPPLPSKVYVSDSWVYPHVYGATRHTRHFRHKFRGLSPCVWGHPMKKLIFIFALGSIPMCMGPPSG